MKLRSFTAALLALSLASAAFAQGDARQAALEFQKIMKDLQTKSKTLGADQLLEELERNLIPFIETYPDSPEAAMAHNNLGQFYAQSGRPDDAIKHLKAYLAIESIKQPRDEIMAKYMIASSYLAKEDFDAAEVALREIAESARYEERTKQMAAKELARIPILRKLRIGMQAIPIAAETTDGKPFRLRDLGGKVVLLDFWASWCVPCKREMPSVKKLYGDFHGDGFEIIGISLDNDRNSFERYLSDETLPWRQIFDGKGWQSEIGQLYAVSSIPATFLIDRKGKIRHKNLRGEQLREAVEALLAER